MSNTVTLMYFSGHGQQTLREFKTKEEAVLFLKENCSLRQIHWIKHGSKKLIHIADFKAFVSEDNWIQFDSVNNMPLGPVWVIRWSSEEDDEGELAHPWIVPATALTHKAWGGEKKICAGWKRGNHGEMNLSKAGVIAWMPREAAPEIPDNWRSFICDDALGNLNTI